MAYIRTYTTFFWRGEKAAESTAGKKNNKSELSNLDDITEYHRFDKTIAWCVTSDF